MFYVAEPETSVKRSTGRATFQDIDDAVLKFLVDCRIPLSATERQSCKDLFYLVAPEYQVNIIRIAFSWMALQNLDVKDN